MMACNEVDSPTVALSEINFNDSIVSKNFKHDSIAIIYSLSSGMCVGYCEIVYGFHPRGIEKIEQSHGGGNRMNFPPLQHAFPFSGKDYQELIASVDTNALSLCQETIGCPGCNDGPVETVEVWYGNFHKTVYIEYGRTAYPIQALVEKMRYLVKNVE